MATETARTTRTARQTEVTGSLDAMSLLVRDLPGGPLLTAEQEQALARRMRGEDVRVPAPGSPRPSPREALDRMVEQNMRLVMAVARKYQGRGVSIEDLVQEGAIGLRRAAERFDPDQGCRFGTYAIWWIRQAMARAVAEDGRLVRLPSNVIAQIGQITRATDELRLKLGRNPTAAETARHLGLSAAQVEEAMQLTRQPVSIDAPIGDEEDRSFEDMLVDPDPTPEAQEEQRCLSDDVVRVLDQLPEREQRVVKLRFGIGHPHPRTAEEVARLLGVSRQVVQQAEMRALARLRHSHLRRHLREYAA